MTGCAILNRVPAGFMLYVVVAAADSKIVLGPDDLSSHHQAAGVKAVLHECGLSAGMPDIGNVAREKRPRLAPVGHLSNPTWPIVGLTVSFR
jgi:hypothetical protein